MDNIYEYLKENYLSLIAILLLLIIIVFQFFSFSNKSDEDKNVQNDNIIAYQDTEESDNSEEIVVDIKGAVKKTGLYKMKKDDTINDVVIKAGGLLKSATTVDINLGKKVYNEMVIYVSTKTEYKRRNERCVCSNDTVENNSSYEIASKDTFVSDYNNKTKNDSVNKVNDDTGQDTSNSYENNGKININSASLEQLQKIPGVGEAKAEKIIAYRNEKGLFKSIEDIKNVSGIGNSIYEKIKDYITI